MKPEEIIEMMNICLTRQGKSRIVNREQSLQTLGFRSLDFSELVLRVEDSLGRELELNASKLRSIMTVQDVVTFFIDSVE